MPMFPEAWMSELLSKSDLVSIASAYVQLKPKGGRMWGCCPFHNEKTASFSVQRDKQLYYCFGCHAGGGVIQFVMEMERLPYVDAVKYLAERAGMELPGEVNDDRLRQEHALRERIFQANKEAAHYYFDKLRTEQGAAQAYLLRRGISAQAVKRFGLGYAPPGWENLCGYMQEKGYAKDTLIAAGLAYKGKKNGECYDAFRDRIIFPIIDTSGRVLGFGARTMGDDTPKYINTGDTPVYNKRNHLYGLNLLKRKRLTDIVMVEGYMDVISLSMGGVENVAAGLGTAMTVQQARLLKRYVPAVYLCYDGDSAGQNAALRGMDILAGEGLDVRVVVIPGGRDPDEFVRQNGKEAFLDLKAKALSCSGFKLESMAAEFDLDTPDGREAFAKRACAFVSGLEPVERERYVPLIARKAAISKETVEAQCALGGKGENSAANYRHTKSRESGKNGGNKTEETLLACMLCSSEGAAAVSAGMSEAELSFSEPYAALADVLLLSGLNGSVDVPMLLAEQTGAFAELLCAIQVRAEDMQDPVSIARDCVKRLRRARIAERIEALNVVLRTPDDPGFAEACRSIAALQRELNELK